MVGVGLWVWHGGSGIVGVVGCSHLASAFVVRTTHLYHCCGVSVQCVIYFG